MKSLKLFQKYFLNQQPADGPIEQHDFDMHIESVDIEQYKKDILAHGFYTKTVATIHHMGKPYEVFQIDVLNDKQIKKLLIFAGVHGNEFAATLAVLDLLQDIKSSPGIYTN